MCRIYNLQHLDLIHAKNNCVLPQSHCLEAAVAHVNPQSLKLMSTALQGLPAVIISQMEKEALGARRVVSLLQNTSSV